VGWSYWGSGSHTRVNGQIVIQGYYPGVVTRTIWDSFTVGARMTQPSWTNADGQTLEARVELVNRNASTTLAELGLGTTTSMYCLWKGYDFITLWKYSANASQAIIFSCEGASVPDSNVVLSLAMTRRNANAVVTVRAVAKDDLNLVFYERSIVDTPGADPALTSAEFYNLSGMNLVLSSDPPGPSFITGGAVVGLFQYNDGGEPPAIVTFDNLELWHYEIPKLGVERAVRVSWSAPAGVDYSVESAPTVLGPWLPVPEPDIPGVQKLSVPLSRQAEFFRLRQAP
jgi:hypothetical protein